ncbi:MAG: A/G-specific adenine glycosylase [Cellulomonas sp.]|uniref:A/G-specific adenine glycosylase n=1 Tax=Cellulomonas sp. TaxID=40001 RepID=UPI0025895B0B|nr:A/G-specific adenine glycosylase [Cellulomonas sp.]MCR6705397.1 A/G-specific adenine glycosylase [Cellulomonas sp.]
MTRPASSSSRVGATLVATDAGTAADLVADVVGWYDEHARDLPWRAPDRTPWGVLVSEVMLQQTPVVRVEPAWRAWMERWPTPADLATAPTADVLRAWDRLGYPRRALRLVQCAQAVVERHAGHVPDDEDALLALPGVGAYTAAAVRSFAFGRRAVVLDTNVRRVLARAVDGHALPAPTQTRAEVARAAALVPADDAGAARWAQASMELGALVCTARSPRCEVCPLVSSCAWVAAGRPADQHAHRRRTQAWAGTDRQVRGRIMALLRESPVHVPEPVLDEAWPATPQRARALAGLLADGLVVESQPSPDEPPLYALPA